VVGGVNGERQQILTSDNGDRRAGDPQRSPRPLPGDLCCRRPSFFHARGGQRHAPKKSREEKKSGPRTRLELSRPVNERGGWAPVPVALIPRAAPSAPAAKPAAWAALVQPGKPSRSRRPGRAPESDEARARPRLPRPAAASTSLPVAVRPPADLRPMRCAASRPASPPRGRRGERESGPVPRPACL
jgi:hypothetical protein